jgi:protein-disulfide isomerase
MIRSVAEIPRKGNSFMKYSLGLITALCLMAPMDLLAQGARGPRVPNSIAGSAVKTLSSSKPTPANEDQAAALATLNGQTITLGELDPAVAQGVAKLGERIAQARSEILELQINTLLLAAEAKKRRVTPAQLYETEVTKHVTDPSDAEIAQLLTANRDQLEGDRASLRIQAISFLRADREQKLSEALAQRLATGNPVVRGVDINTPNIAPNAVVATVGGTQITADSLAERFKPIIYKLRLNAYQITVDALTRTVNDLLLLAEANRRNLPPETIMRTEVTDKVHPPTEAEIEKFYNENKARITGDLASTKAQIAAYLQQQSQDQAEHALSERLRKGADLRILITEPEPPVQIIDIAGEPVRGDANAPVTVVEFTDFECPACGAMYPVLEQVLPTYGARVRFVVRNFPLLRHAHSRKAAEAADAAHAQGKFFEYTALLFKRQNALDVPSLKKYASEIGLDRARFDAELDSGKYAEEVRHDLDDGQVYGVDVTPTIFINGVALRELTPEALRAAIDKALGARAGGR